MTKHDATRREFLVRAAVGAGVAASAGLVPAAYAQNPEQPKGTDSSSASQNHSGEVQQGAFFDYEDAATIAVFAERLMPGAPGKPGAGDAGVLNYIDLALAGAYADLQDFYRRGLAQLDAHCRKNYNEPFARLDAARQDEVIAALEQGKANEFAWPTAQAFFETVRTHTMEGMFADPIYGGNKDFAGWRLVNFPGIQAVFTPTDLQSKKAFTRAPLIGLQTKGPMRMG
jgi:gluconate 2-dehydrogenase gamma chain